MLALSFLAGIPSKLPQSPLDRHTSGILYLCSLSALTLHAIAVIPTTTPSMIAVFARQFLGCAYQPPAGDQTCLGYLFVAMSSAIDRYMLVSWELLHVRNLGTAAHECLCGLHYCGCGVLRGYLPITQLYCLASRWK
jgi:hypothetical protein